MYWYDGYHGLSRYMAVYHGIWCHNDGMKRLKQVHTSTYKYIPVHTFMNDAQDGT